MKLNEDHQADWYEQNRKQILNELQRNYRMARNDDELQRGGDPLGLAVAIVLGIAVTVIMITGIITLASSVRERITAPIVNSIRA